MEKAFECMKEALVVGQKIKGGGLKLHWFQAYWIGLVIMEAQISATKLINLKSEKGERHRSPSFYLFIVIKVFHSTHSIFSKKKTYMSSFKLLYSNTKNGNMGIMFEMHAIDRLN